VRRSWSRSRDQGTEVLVLVSSFLKRSWQQHWIFHILDSHSRILGHVEVESPFWGKGGRRGSAMAPFERAMLVSYRLSIVTVALSVTIRPQFAIECLRRSNQQGGGSLWAKISGCFPWSRPLIFGSAESEYSRLTNREIISEEFQPMWSQSTNVTDRRTDGQTDDMRSQDRALHSSASRGKKKLQRVAWISVEVTPKSVLQTDLSGALMQS